MKVKVFQIRAIKDFIRSLPPNVVSQSFWVKGNGSYEVRSANHFIVIKTILFEFGLRLVSVAGETGTRNQLSFLIY